MERPRIGIGVIVRDGEKVLLGLRRNAHGEGTWGFPGGHLEFGEPILDCAKREALEETGLRPTDLAYGPYTNDIFELDEKHYVTLFVIAEYEGGIPQRLEPQKCEEWRWFPWNQLPVPLFLPIQNLIKQGFKVN